MKVVFERAEEVAAGVWTFWFQAPKQFEYLAGQITEVYLPHSNADNRGERRWFTLSSSPTEKLLGITMKFSDPGSTYKQVMRALKPGDEVSFSDPIGDFVVPKNPAIPLIFVAGGIGVAGIRSLVKFLLDTTDKRTVQLLYSVRNEQELAYAETFAAYGLTYEPTVTQPSLAWQGKSGRITSAAIIEMLQEYPDALVYLTGPKPMIQQLLVELKQAGIQDYQLVIDYYTGYSQL